MYFFWDFGIIDIFLLVFSIVYFILWMLKNFFIFNCFIRLFKLYCVFFSVFFKILFFVIKIVGFLYISFFIKLDFKFLNVINVCKNKRVKIGMILFMRGILVFCIGIVVSLEIIIVMISLNGWSLFICFFFISFIINIINIYKINVLIKMVIIIKIFFFLEFLFVIFFKEKGFYF